MKVDSRVISPLKVLHLLLLIDWGKKAISICLKKHYQRWCVCGCRCLHCTTCYSDYHHCWNNYIDLIVVHWTTPNLPFPTDQRLANWNGPCPSYNFIPDIFCFFWFSSLVQHTFQIEVIFTLSDTLVRQSKYLHLKSFVSQIFADNATWSFIGRS